MSVTDAVAMIFVMKELKILRLGAKVTVAAKPLGAKESSIVGLIKALHCAKVLGWE